MSANDGSVDHDVFRVGLLAQHRQQLGPDAFCRPPAEPAMNVAEVAVFLRKVTPVNACPISVQNSVDKQAVIPRRDSNMTSPTGDHIFKACLTRSSWHTVVSRSIILSKTFLLVPDSVCRACSPARLKIV